MTPTRWGTDPVAESRAAVFDSRRALASVHATTPATLAHITKCRQQLEACRRVLAGMHSTVTVPARHTPDDSAPGLAPTLRRTVRHRADTEVLTGAGVVRIPPSGETLGPYRYAVAFDPVIDPHRRFPSALQVAMPAATAARCHAAGSLLHLEMEDGRRLHFIISAVRAAGAELSVVSLHPPS